MPHAPFAGTPVRFRPPTGHDDLLLLEAQPGLALAVALLSDRAVDASGAPLDAEALTVGDVDALIVQLRRETIGDLLVAEGRCSQCGSAIDIAFEIEAFLGHHRPRPSRLASAAGEGGWWRLRRAPETTFRLPLAREVLDARTPQDLLDRCIPGAPSAPAARAAQRAMESLSPSLRTAGHGRCPDCEAAVVVDVDARRLCLQELRFMAAAVLEEVHLLAGAYGWPEVAILDLPSTRRVAYADLVRSGQGLAVDLELVDG